MNIAPIAAALRWRWSRSLMMLMAGLPSCQIGPPVQHTFHLDRSRAVEDDAERALGVMVEKQHHRSSEVRVGLHGSRNEEAAGVRAA